MVASWLSVGGDPPGSRPTSLPARMNFPTVFRSSPVPRAIARRPMPLMYRRNTSCTSIIDSSR